MSSQLSSVVDIAAASSEHVCYLHCNFCNTILAVSVPGTILFNVVTVRCGHCANLLSVNMASLLQTLPTNATPTTPPQDNHLHHHHHHHQQYSQNQNLNLDGDSCRKEFGSSSKCNKATMQLAASTHINEEPPTPPRMLPIRPPEKRQRVPSAYNRFIKEEIQRIKANNPDISHREAFSTAAKNWAHFPHIHFGLSVDGNKQVKMDAAFAGEAGMQKTQDFY